MSVINVLKDAALDTEQRVIAGEDRIAEQAALIGRLLRSGRPTHVAEAALKAMLDVQNVRRRDLDYWRSRAAQTVN